MGVNLSDDAQIRAGYLYTRRNASVETGSPILPEDKRDDAGLDADGHVRQPRYRRSTRLAVSQRRSSMPTSTIRSARDLDWERLELGIGLALPVRSDVVWMTLAGGTDLNSAMPADRYFMLGGPGSFPGFELGELRLTDYWTASGSYLWKIKDIMSIRGPGAVCRRAAGSRPGVRPTGIRHRCRDSTTTN